MTTDKHTPGPWEKGIFWNSVRISAGGKHIADVYDHRFMGEGHEVGDENAANARLIAAAPDMLAVLRAIVEAGRRSDQSCAVYCAEIALIAIAKARGEG